MMFGRRRTRKQLALSILTAIGAVSILSVMVGNLDRNPLLLGTIAMTVIGLIGIWLFDSGLEWRWLADLSDYLTIVGLVGFWSAFTDSFLSLVVAVIFYWGLATLVKRAKYSGQGA